MDNINDFERKSTLVSRNITVLGKRTSMRLEPEMWTALRDISRRERCKIHDLCSLVAMRKNSDTSLTAAIRVFLMLYYKASSTEEGHRRSGHGDFAHMLARARVHLDHPLWKDREHEDADTEVDIDMDDLPGPRTSFPHPAAKTDRMRERGFTVSA